MRTPDWLEARIERETRSGNTPKAIADSPSRGSKAQDEPTTRGEGPSEEAPERGAHDENEEAYGEVRLRQRQLTYLLTFRKNQSLNQLRSVSA